MGDNDKTFVFCVGEIKELNNCTPYCSLEHAAKVLYYKACIHITLFILLIAPFNMVMRYNPISNYSQQLLDCMPILFYYYHTGCICHIAHVLCNQGWIWGPLVPLSKKFLYVSYS